MRLSKQNGQYTALTIGGSGDMNDYDHITVDNIWRTDAPWGYDLTSVTIGNDITSIGDYAFIGCQQLSSLSIGDGGFRNCVVINSTVTGSRGNKGAIIGLNDNSTLRNLYLYGDNQNRAVGYGGSGTNVGRARKVTIGSGISSVTPAATDMANGFVYNNERYYCEGLELTLASNLSATGKYPVYSAKNTALTGNTYTVNNSDVTFISVQTDFISTFFI